MGKQAIVLVAAAALLLAGCDSKRPVAVSAANAAATTTTARETTATSGEYVASGPLVVEQQVDVATQREGIVTDIRVEVGQHVRKGELLAELDHRQLQADRDAAAAKVRSVQYELQHWEAEAQVRQADLDRDEEMWRAQLITAKQVEHSRYAVQGAKFETQRERENLVNAQNALRSLELELEKTRVVAPFDGVVARRYVRQGQKLGMGERVFWVTAMAPILVKFTVPQEFAGKLKRGGEVSVVSPAAPEEKHPARIRLISPVVDPSSGTLEVEAELASNSSDLLPGMTVNIRVPSPR